jgi:chorismate mutase
MVDINNYMFTFDMLLESIKDTIKQTDVKLQDFLSKRQAGAKKIALQSQKKGGYSVLTAIHFKAKEIPYQECIKHLNDVEFVEKKADACWDKLKDWKNMSQREFQHVMGQLEAYGEVYIREIKPSSIKFD